MSWVIRRNRDGWYYQPGMKDKKTWEDAYTPDIYEAKQYESYHEADVSCYGTLQIAKPYQLERVLEYHIALMTDDRVIANILKETSNDKDTL